MAGGGVAVLFGGELVLLQLRVGGHVALSVVASELEHAVVEGVETRQRHELELVPHSPQLALELGDGGVVEVFLPVEGRRAVVAEELARELGVDGLREGARLLEAGC